MGALRDPQYEAFALALAERRPRIEAYKDAGFAPHRGNAARLAKRAEVVARVEELMNEAAEFANVRRVRVVLEVDRVGRANMRDFYEREIDKASGEPTGRMMLRPILDLPRELSAAIAEVEFGDDGAPVRLKLHDKNQANFTLLKYLGGLPEATPTTTNVSIFNQLSIEDQRVLAEALEALPAGASDADQPAAHERPEG